MTKDLKPSLEEYFDSVEAFLDSFIENGDEQELFISSYLHGHFSVVAAGVLLNEQKMLNFEKNANTHKKPHTIGYQSNLKYLLHESINAAIANQELSHSDAEQVRLMVEKIPA